MMPRSLLTLTVLLSIFLVASCGGKRTQTVDIPDKVQFYDVDPMVWDYRDPRSYEVHGIDVSRWQGYVDWYRVAGAGMRFAFIKATEGSDVRDPNFRTNWDGAARAGLARGGYHYHSFCSNVDTQAANFITFVPNDPSALPPVLDMEWNHGGCNFRPPAHVIRNMIAEYRAYFEGHYGKPMILYTTVDFYRDNQLSLLPDTMIWLRSVAKHPHQVYHGQAWTFWQHTSTGRVDGVNGNVDINAFGGTRRQWEAWKN